jgi:prefoldin subunit 5
MFGSEQFMAATPTEVLNDDIKELKGEIRENRTKIDLVWNEVQRLAIAQAQMRVELLADNHKIALAQAEMKGEFRFVKLLLSLVLAGIAGSVWQFYGLNARVNGIEVKVNGIDARLDKVDARLDKVDARLDKVDARLERLDSSVSKILEQTKPAVPARISITTP